MYSKLLNCFLIAAFALLLVSCGGGGGGEGEGEGQNTINGANIKTGFESTNGFGVEIQKMTDGTFQYVDTNGRLVSPSQLPDPLSKISASDANGMYMEMFSKFASAYDSGIDDSAAVNISDSVAGYISASDNIRESLNVSIETNSLEIAAVAKIITEAFVNNIANAVVAPPGGGLPPGGGGLPPGGGGLPPGGPI